MKQAALYLRVSTSEQAERDLNPEGYSIPAQREACLRKAQQMEVTVAGEYVDQGESARSADRPQLQAMLSRLEECRDIDYVIVHKVDRLARNRLDDVTITLRVQQAGAQLVSVSESIDETRSGQLLHAIMAANAEFFSRNLGLETKKGLRQKFQAGGTVGLAPLGYVNMATQIDGRDIRTVVLDEDRAPLIKWAFEAYPTGEWTLESLREELTARGLTTRPTRKRPLNDVKTPTLGRILSNPYYIGMVTYEGVQQRGRHDPLIMPHLFLRVAEVLRAHAVSGEKDRKHQHYLKGTIFCGRCGSRLLITRARGKSGGIYFYFFCSGRQRGNGCRQRYLAIHQVEQAVERYYQKIELPQLHAEEKRAALIAALAEQREALTQAAVRANRRIDRLDGERSKLLQAHLADTVPLDVLKREQARLTTELQHARSTVAAAEAKTVSDERILAEALALVADCSAPYRQADPDIRRSFNQVFFRRLFVGDEGVVGAELTDPYAEILADDLIERLQNTLKKAPKGPESRNGRAGDTNCEPDSVLAGAGSSYVDEG